MHTFACSDLINISLVLVLKPGMLHEEDDEIRSKLARHQFATALSLTHWTPSTEGTRNLYIPCLFLVLLTENDIYSAVLWETALNVQSIWTSTPTQEKKKMGWNQNKYLYSENLTKNEEKFWNLARSSCAWRSDWSRHQINLAHDCDLCIGIIFYRFDEWKK